MTVFTEILPDEDAEAGIHRTDFATAVCTWWVMQADENRPTVADVALAFNTTPELIRQAIGDHYWMTLENPEESDPTKQFIWCEGE